MIRKTKIYLDTSVINYLAAPHMPQQMRDTLRLWDLFADDEFFDVVISEVVDREIQACPEPKLSFFVEKLAEIPYTLVTQTDEIVSLSKRYIEYGVLSAKNLNDLLHIAHATIYGCHRIASWNFKHFVNDKTMDRMNAVHFFTGHPPMKIVTPSMILGELNYDR